MPHVLRKIRTLKLSLGGSYSVLTKPLYPRSLGNIFHRSTCPAQGLNKKSHNLHSWAGSKYWRALSITFPGNSSQLGSPIPRSINKTSSLLPGAKSISVPAMFGNTESSDPRSNRLIWVDLEMTGLDFVEDRILEIACLITEGDLKIVAEGPHIIIHESDEVLNRMGEWCTQHHGESGLTEAVRKSKISLAEAEQMVLDFVRQHTPKGKCPLAGNTISVDRSFILKHMPLLAEHLHYRVLDVSTVKELCRRWYEKDLKVAPVKKNKHRAVDDILESIEELKFYRSAIFK